MHDYIQRKYYFISKLDTNLINRQDKKTTIIYRNYAPKNIDVNNILKIKSMCKKNGNKFLLSNNVKLAIMLDLDGVYIPSFNKSTRHLSYSFKKRFNIFNYILDCFYHILIINIINCEILMNFLYNK